DVTHPSPDSVGRRACASTSGYSIEGYTAWTNSWPVRTRPSTPAVSFVAIGLFVATIGFSIGRDADIFRDVAGAEVSGAARACRRTSRKLGRPERHTAAGGLAVARDAARARL